MIDNSTKANYTHVYHTQRQFFESGKTRSYAFRKQQIMRLKKCIQTHQSLISEALQQDLHKAPTESYITEIGFVYQEINYALKHLKKWMKPQNVSTPLIAQPSSSRIYRDPLGLTLIIGPWNYPFHLIMSPLVGAIAGGNCAILKPSEETPSTAQAIEKLIKEAFDPEYISVVQGNGSEVVPALMDNFPFNHVFFTGSVAVGKIIMAAAATHLTPVTLELGGKSPCIVDNTANLPVAARRITWGKFINAGQTCVAPDYLLVHHSVKDRLVKLIAENLREFYGENPHTSPDYPRMANMKRFNAIAKFLKTGNILLGGQTNPEDKYISPTLLDEVSWDDPVMQEEIFGPLLPILTYQTLEEIPQLIAKQPFPLALYLFTSDNQTEKYILENIRFGGGCINDTAVHLSNPAIPFGGVGTSGLGSYHGKYSFDTFTHAKGVLKTSTMVDIPLRYPPYANKLKYIKVIMK
jgi:aldehyde dehydrogenase (NAD+)